MSGLWNSVFGGGGSSAQTMKLMADPKAFISGENLEGSRDRFISEMEKQQKSGPIGIDANAAQGAQAATATQQAGLGDFLMQRARGQVPSVADKMLQQRQGQNLNQMAALAQNAGAQGGSSMRNLFRAQGEAQANIQNEAAIQKLQEQMQAAAQANSLFGTQRAQDIQAGQMLQNANLFNAGMQDTKNQQNLQNILALRKIDEDDRQAMIRKALADSETKESAENRAVGAQSQALGSVASLASMAMMMSDERQKTDVKSGTEGAANFLRSIWNNDKMSTGDKVGKTAQSGFGNLFGSIAESYGAKNNYTDQVDEDRARRQSKQTQATMNLGGIFSGLQSGASNIGMHMIDNVVGGMDGSRAPGQGGISGAGMDGVPGGSGIGQERQFDASGSVGKGVSKMFGGQGISQSGGVGGASMMSSIFSDEKLKNQVIPGEGAASQFLRAIEPKTYQYKNQAYGQGPQLGVMAQDLEKAGPVGKQMVIDTPQGKMVDYGKGFGALMATNAALQQQVDDINKKLENKPVEKPKRGLLGGGLSIQPGSDLDQLMKESMGDDAKKTAYIRWLPEDLGEGPLARNAKRKNIDRG